MPNRSHKYKKGWSKPPGTSNVPPLAYLSPTGRARATEGSERVKRLTPHCQRRKLACPYRQKYPRCKPKASACLHPFTDISRLKEHLYRCHMEQHQCLRCRATFDSEADLEVHMQARDICQPRQQPQSQVFGKEIQAMLKKRCSKKSDEEKWTGVYQTLFPDDTDIPIPYHDELPLAEYRECAQLELPSRLKDALALLVSPNTGFTLLPEPMMAEIIRIVCACNDDLVQEFQHDQQRESAQDQSIDLTSTCPYVHPENSLETSSDGGLSTPPRDMPPNRNPQQNTFSDTALRTITEPQAPVNDTLGVSYDDQFSATTTTFDWIRANSGIHQSAEYQAWCPSEGSSTHLPAAEGFFPSTDAQFMPALPASPENLSIWSASLPMMSARTDEAGFATEMYTNNMQTTGSAFLF